MTLDLQEKFDDPFLTDFLYSATGFVNSRQPQLDESPFKSQEEFEIRSFNGAAVIGGSLVCGNEGKDLPPLNRNKVLELLTSQGQFCCILTSLNRQLEVVTSDFFGFKTVYYYFDRVPSQSPDQLTFVASNRFNYLVEFLKNKKAKLTFNNKNIISYLYQFNLFSRQLNGHSTFCNEINVLPMDQMIIIDSEGPRFALKPLHRNEHNPDKGQYEHQIHLGTNAVQDSLTAISKSRRFEDFICDLSGGKDSRLTLASVMNSELKDNFQLRTIENSKCPDDLRIANNIAAHYKIPWLDRFDSEQFPITIEQGFDIWQHFNSNRYYRIGFAAYMSKGANKIMQLNGCGGELFKAWSKPFYDRKISKSENFEVQSKELFKYYFNFEEVNKSLFDDALEEFRATLKSLPGEHFGDRLESYGHYHIIRYHAGSLDKSRYFGELNWAAIASPNLYKAASLIEKNLFYDQAVMFDILDHINPEMNFIEYDELNWSDKILTRSPSYDKYKNLQLPDASLDNWRAGQDAWGLDRGRKRNNRPNRDFNYDQLSDIAYQRIMKNIEKICDYESYTSNIFNEHYIRYLNDVIAKNQPNLLQSLAVISSVADIVQPTRSWYSKCEKLKTDFRNHSKNSMPIL